MSEPSVDDLCRIYVKIRTKKQDLTKELEEKIAELDAKLDTVASAMKDMLAAAGAKSIKTEHGTVYATTKKRYYPMDWSTFNQWVAANSAVDLLEKRVSQRNMAQWLEENPTNPPPGLQAEIEQTVTVRKS